MKKDTVVELRRPGQGQDLLSTMLRDGAQRLVAQAVEAEFADFLARAAGERLADGRAAVVRNGFQPEREILTGLGSVRVRVPKACSRGEEAAVFRSSLVPPYVRRAKSVEAVLPWLYLLSAIAIFEPVRDRHIGASSGSAYSSHLRIGVIEPAGDRHIRASGGVTGISN